MLHLHTDIGGLPKPDACQGVSALGKLTLAINNFHKSTCLTLSLVKRVTYGSHILFLERANHRVPSRLFTRAKAAAKAARRASWLIWPTTS